MMAVAAQYEVREGTDEWLEKYILVSAFVSIVSRTTRGRMYFEYGPSQRRICLSYETFETHLTLTMKSRVAWSLTNNVIVTAMRMSANALEINHI